MLKISAGIRPSPVIVPFRHKVINGIRQDNQNGKDAQEAVLFKEQGSHQYKQEKQAEKNGIPL